MARSQGSVQSLGFGTKSGCPILRLTGGRVEFEIIIFKSRPSRSSDLANPEIVGPTLVGLLGTSTFHISQFSKRETATHRWGRRTVDRSRARVWKK